MHVASWIWVLIPITAIVCGIFAGVAKRWIRLKEREMKLSSEMTAEKAAQYAAHTERLEQRVRVLERIATDPAERTAREIDQLRNS